MLSKFHHRNTGKKLAFKGQNEAKTRSIDVIGHSKSLGKKLTRRRTFKSEFFFWPAFHSVRQIVLPTVDLIKWHLSITLLTQHAALCC